MPKVPSIVISFAAILLVIALTSCDSFRSPAGRSRSSHLATHGTQAFMRHDPVSPFLVQRIYYGDAAKVRQMVEVQDDQAARFRGMRRVGDGIISVGIKDGRGRWLESFECGGHLFVVGAEGQACQVVVQNESRTRLEVICGVDGRDASRGIAFDANQPGVIVPPMKRIVIGATKGRQPAMLRFGPGRSVPSMPIIENVVAPSAGSIMIAIFNEKDRFPWEGSAHAGSQYAPGKVPPRAIDSDAMPQDYR